MRSLTIRQARRLALARAGLLKPQWTGLPRRATGRGKRARDAAHSVIRRFGYLQLDTVSIAGARSHAIVLMSRLEGFAPELGEDLLQPGAPLFEYWGHEACWIPMELYPAFEFRRQQFRHHPWWGDLIGEHPDVAEGLRRRIRDEGPLRSLEMEGKGGRGWWDLKVAKRVAAALWSSGELAIRERRNFQRFFDLAERVIPASVRSSPLPVGESLQLLLLKALDGHGWATAGTLAATWRLTNRRQEVEDALESLHQKGAVVRCDLDDPGGRPSPGWIRPEDRDLASRLDRARPRRNQGVLLSPFDPVLWDRARVKRLFGFEQLLEIFKPAAQRKYGYYCLPVLAGERLVCRVDLKAERKAGLLRVLSCHFEDAESSSQSAAAREAVASALFRYAGSLGLELLGSSHSGGC